ncbi:hypothetical protein ACFV7Q_06335 [Streptomyces sp. NPDC059851]|uniref:hypothetical protein n=1 Tax=Streptomyces sp. NPDC059851 TaxID=3346971 RepID=UPI00365633E6
MHKYAAGLRLDFAVVNGEPALIVGGDGVLLVEFDEGLVRQVRAVVNPHKLEFLQRQLSRSPSLSNPSG